MMVEVNRTDASTRIHLLLVRLNMIDFPAQTVLGIPDSSDSVYML